jgi:O-antigen biosynthesis protein
MPVHPRLKAALRVLREVYWRGLSMRRVEVRVTAFGKSFGLIDEIRLERSRLHLAGVHAIAPARLQSDLGCVLVDPGRVEDLTVAGVDHLTWVDEASGQSVPIPLTRAHHHVAAAWRLAVTLGLFPLLHLADIWRYLARGDSPAGDRLERALLPHRFLAESVPFAAQGLFGQAPLPVIRAPVDIIVPIHNAADLVAECLDHLHRHTPEPHRLWLINDASSDAAIAPLLKDFAARHPDARVLTNEQNEGFVGTVNRGLGQATGDVVLLNSDAFVPEGWLSRLMAPLVSDPRLASVTPMSSDAEIVNVPLACTPRHLQPGEALGADRAARRLDWRNAQADLPTGVGFCMAMARTWLDRVPRLDPVFGAGYGEEVDWCRKTAALGARHVAAGHLFVEHRAGSSFGPTKAARIAKNNQIISTRYPAFDTLVDRFRKDDPLAAQRVILGLGLFGQKTRLKVYLAHRLGGGAEMWLTDAVMGDLAAQGAALVLRDGDLAGQVIAELHSEAGVVKAMFPTSDIADLLAVLPGKELVYSCLVGAKDPLELARLAVTSLTPKDRFRLLIHDFLPLCPSYTLIGSDRSYCNLPDPDACQTCYARLPVTSGTRPPLIREWRAAWQRLAVRADEITTFSQDSRAHVVKVWPDLAGKVIVRPHQVAPMPWLDMPTTGVLTLGVLGNIGHAKGAEVLQALGQHVTRTFRIVVLGRIDPAYAHPALVIHGPYAREDIAALARRYGVSAWFIPSVWPETFSYTTNEGLATGLPVFAFDLGAQGEAVKAAPNGHVLAAGKDLSEADFREICEKSAKVLHLASFR